MLLEHLFNHLGETLLFGLAVGLFALPMAIVGAVLRRRGRRSRLRWELVETSRRPLRDLTKGRAATVGVWRNLARGSGLLEDGEARCLVERGEDVPDLADGTKVLVAGYATRQEDDPRGGHYRTGARLWVIEGAGEELLVTEDTERSSRGLRTARLSVGLGAGLMAAGVALAAATGALCWRAADEEPAAYETVNVTAAP